MRTLHINGRAVTIEAEDETPLLWIIRDTIGLTGTKFGCGIGMCGACTVHVGDDLHRNSPPAFFAAFRWQLGAR